MHVYMRGSLQQKLRLASGFVLFAFATAHFLNHALGLISLEAMHEAQALRIAVTRSIPGSIILAAALVTHIGLALYRIAKRRTWRMPRWEAAQILLGLAIPFLLFPHIVNTRIAHQAFGVEDSYLYELVRLWPDSAITQSLLLLIVWTHGCLGLHYWLRLSEGYRRIAPALLALAVAIPVLALAGFAVAGRQTSEIMSDAQALAALKERSNWPEAAAADVLSWLRIAVRALFFGLAAAAIGVAAMRWRARAALGRTLRISYVDGPSYAVTPGPTLLEISRSVGMAHASVCGGRGRCSTCRVRIAEGLEELPPPSGAEAITLRSIEAPDNIRLACQIRPAADMTVAIVSRPATPGPPQESFDDIKQFTAAHIRGILEDRLVEVRSSDTAALSRWLAQETGQPITLRAAAGSEFALAGARIEFVRDRPTAAIVYQRQGRPITLFQNRLGDAAPLAMRGQRNGYHVLSWTDDSFAFVAVTDLPAADLDRLEEALRPPEPVLKTDAREAVL